jgi:leucyl/phenylalanyl-tRNA--protein transferase
MGRYAAGYFPLYDVDDHFYWERLPIRAMIPLSAQNVARARKLGKRPRKRFVIRFNSAVDEVIAILQNPRVKENTWVRREVVEIYRVLRAAGLLRTVEAYDQRGELAGGLLGLVFPGTFIAETMFSLQSDASKVCLCELVERTSAAGYKLIDVQTPHNIEFLRLYGEDPVGKTPHPCVRVGEQTVPLGIFMRMFCNAATDFGGNLGHWLAIASRLAAGKDVSDLDAYQVAVATPMLQWDALR